MSLYVFQDCADFRLRSLDAGKLWFSHRKALNDPFDCRVELVDDLDDERTIHGHDVADLRPLFRRYYEGGVDGRWDCAHLGLSTADAIVEWCDQRISSKELLERLETQLDRIGVRCFFLDEPTNVLMWAHYAGNHQGYCVQYSAPNIPILPMTYSTTHVRLYLSDFLFSSRASLNRVINTKNSAWAYENEIRITTQPSAEADIQEGKGFAEPLSRFQMRVEAIWLGLNTPQAAKDQLCGLAKERGWRVRQASTGERMGSGIFFRNLEL